MKKIYSGFKQSVNNFSILVYLLSIILSSLIFNNPVIVLVIFGALLLMSFFAKRDDSKSYFKFALIIFLTTVLFNLIINQRGTNIIFQIPFIMVTRESLLNACILAFSFVNLLLAFYIYDALTNVKVIFDLMSRGLRSIAIVFILTIKFIPKIIEIFRNTSYLYKFRSTKKTGKSKLSRQMDLIEIVLNKAVANFMNVSDVLITKGYNNRGKVSKKLYSTKSDYVVLSVSVIAVIFNISMAILKIGKVDFGSSTVNMFVDKNIIIISLINLIMIVIPILIGVSQYLWWKLYVSKITASNMPTAKNFR
ncbi:energy-coupling factor transporter transmembrane component T [Companilactobacillus hulinensis]|uniref:energy-coupling factor transporter transmembrane component T n=1 Tax=Companilactobacillus hulinensis TaxID=2486007 RepID=UPI000F766774|nr:energy-coupling factor transporter transmembrane component T [Companilactobacillus hulinensis]